jgi:hypothetical protein
MANTSSQLSSTTESSAAEITTTLVDVEAEHEKREETTKLFQENIITIPEYYRTEMTKNGIMEKFTLLIQFESLRNKQIRKILQKHNISIPSEFYSQLMDSDLFEQLLNTIHQVDQQTELDNTKLLKQKLHPSNKRQHHNIDVDDNNPSTIDDTNERLTKQLKTSADDISTLTTTSDFAPPTRDSQTTSDH